MIRWSRKPDGIPAHEIVGPFVSTPGERLRASRVFLLAGIAFLAVASFTVYHLNDFARVQAAGIGASPAEPGTLSRVVITNEASKRIAFQLRCDPQEPRSHVLLPRESLEVDVHPELAGKEMPRMIADRKCEATWRGPFGITCRAWNARWQYGKPARKGVMLADEDGACRIATCYSTSRLAKIPSCLSAVYLSNRDHQKR
jgi:hypothetical protein